MAAILLVYAAGSVFLANAYTTSRNRTLSLGNPGSFNLAYDEVSFQSFSKDKPIIRGWWIPKKDSKRVLIMVHPKTSDRTFSLAITKPLWDSGYSMLLIDMQAHGLSDGQHIGHGINEQQDVVAAVDFVKNKGFQPGGIGVIGWSMGAATSLMAMSQTPDIRAVVSDSAYGDLARVAHWQLGLLNFYYPGITFTAKTLWQLDIDLVKPELAIKNIGQRHVFLIHGDLDPVVPIDEVYQLQQAGGANVVSTWVQPGLGHAAGFMELREEYLRRVILFFNTELD